VKVFNVKEKYNFKYTFDVYNLTNTTSFDVPGNEVSQNQYYNAFPSAPTRVRPHQHKRCQQTIAQATRTARIRASTIALAPLA